MNKVLSTFTSKKLLAALVGFLGLLAAKQYTEAAGLLGAYVLAQAGIDATTVRKTAADAEKVAGQVLNVEQQVKQALLEQMAASGVSSS